MEEKNPVVSLVVPTKYRYPYLIKLIDLLRSFNFGEEFELIVQDNNEDNKPFMEYLEGNPYSRLKYFFDPTPVSIGQNCDNAICHSSGEYVCFIGDDDCVTRNFMPCIEWMKRNKMECVFPRRIMYYWPDYCDSGDERSAVHYEPFSHEITYYDTKETLVELLESGCVGIARVPMIYHGIVSKRILDKIWTQCGTYFPGASPDISSAVSLCLVIDKYASFKFPIIIAGNSRSGGGGQKIIKHHALTDFSKLPHLPKNIDEIWCKRIPKIWCNSTIWCESVVEALNTWYRKDLVKRINYERLYENFAVNYFYYRKMAFALTNNKSRLFFKSLNGIIIKATKDMVKFVLRILHLHIRDTRIKVFGINNTKELCSRFEDERYIFNDYFHS